VTDQENPESPSKSASPTEADKTKGKSKSSWLLNSLFLCGLGFLLWGMIAPQFKSGCGCRAYSSYTKANLHNVYLGCKAYWADNGSDSVCTHEIAQSTAYGYVNSPNVELVAFGNESEFLGFAYNKKSPKVFKLNALGAIERLSDSPMDALKFLSRSERGLIGYYSLKKFELNSPREGHE